MGPHRVRHNEGTEYACMRLRAEPAAKELRINTEEAGGLEQRETEKHEPEPENKAQKMQQDRHEGQLALLLHEEVFHTFRCQGNCRRGVIH